MLLQVGLNIVKPNAGVRHECWASLRSAQPTSLHCRQRDREGQGVAGQRL